MTTEDAIAGSCLARRNVERGRFIVTGRGLTVNPDSPVDDNWPLMSAPVTTNTSIQPIYPTKPNTTQETRNWKLGDDIVEAQGIVRTLDGRILLSSVSENRQVEPPEKLVCHSDSEDNSRS